MEWWDAKLPVTDGSAMLEWGARSSHGVTDGMWLENCMVTGCLAVRDSSESVSAYVWTYLNSLICEEEFYRSAYNKFIIKEETFARKIRKLDQDEPQKSKLRGSKPPPMKIFIIKFKVIIWDTKKPGQKMEKKRGKKKKRNSWSDTIHSLYLFGSPRQFETPKDFDPSTMSDFTPNCKMLLQQEGHNEDYSIPWPQTRVYLQFTQHSQRRTSWVVPKANYIVALEYANMHSTFCFHLMYITKRDEIPHGFVKIISSIIYFLFLGKRNSGRLIQFS